MKTSVLRRLWDGVTAPFLIGWIVCRTVSRGWRRGRESGIPFLHAWNMEIQDWSTGLEEKARALEKRVEQLRQETQEIDRKIAEAKKETERKLELLDQEVERLGPEGVLQLGRELEAREKRERAQADSQNGASMKTEEKA